MTTETKPDTSDLMYCDGDEHAIIVNWPKLMGEDCEGYRCGESVDRGEIADHLGVTEEQLTRAGVPEHLAAINGTVDISEYEEDIEDETEETPETSIEIDHCEGPMMNYVYPLPPCFRGDAEAAHQLPGGLCLVEFSDENQDMGLPRMGLALTCGGMDCSWEIAGGYVALGFRPPFGVVSRLPDFAGYVMTPTRALVIQAMREEAERMITHGQRALESYDRIAETLRKNSRED